MEISKGLSPRHNSNVLHTDTNEQSEDDVLHSIELEHSIQSDHHIPPMNALEILRESVRILRFNLTGFMTIIAVLICPVSAIILSNVLVNQSLVKKLALRLLLVVKFSGVPLRPFIEQLCQKFSEMVVSAITCFPLFATLSLLSKTAVVYSVDCTYSRKKFDSSKFYVFISNIWKCVIFTYLWACVVISACVLSFLILLISVSSVFLVMGFPADLILYPALALGMVFSVILANAIIICNLAIVISVLEDVSGLYALSRSSSLVKGQTQTGLLIFIGSAIGMVFVEGLFDHRVKTLSYGDGTSRIWEGPLLVVMYSFVGLIDSMMNAVFYFSCKSYQMELESEPVLESLAGSSDVQ